MKKILMMIAVVSAASFAARAQALPTLLIPSDARSLAVGGNTLVREPSFKTFRATVSYGMWAPQRVKDKLLAADVKFRVGEKLSLGVDFADFIGNPYAVSNAQGTVSGTFTPFDLRIGVGARMAFGKGFAASLKARLIHSTLSADAKGTAFGVDVGAEYATGGLRVELAGCNLGTSVKYIPGGTSYTGPMYVKAGVAYTAVGITPAVELDYLFSGALMVAAGVEYNLLDIAFLRVGYHYGPADRALPSFVSAGLGVRYWGISLDVAYLTASKTLGNTLLVGLGYSF